MISCKEATLLSERSLEKKLSSKDRIQLWLHNRLCKACHQYKIQSEWIDKALKSLEVKDGLTDLEKERIKQALKDTPA